VAEDAERKGEMTDEIPDDQPGDGAPGEDQVLDDHPVGSAG
jgi:hypothetical protein